MRLPEPGKEITGSAIKSAQEGKDSQGKPTVNFTFDEHIGNRFWDLTTANRPSKGEIEFHRKVAIVLDGQIQTMPALNRTDPLEWSDHRQFHAG